MARSEYRYRLYCRLADGQEIEWETAHPQTAHRWFAEAIETQSPIDRTGGSVVSVELYRDGRLIKFSEAA